MVKNLLFITGTRADFGKIKSLLHSLDTTKGFEYSLFVTGMHTLSRYGYTVDEVYKSIGEHRLLNGFRSVYTFMNQMHGDSMEQILSNTISGLSKYVNEFKPDMIVVHGDRVEALAGAIVGALRNILVAHIEGGELSGTIDEVIRHAITKFAHLHFVSNEEAANRLIQLGEQKNSIYVIGSPDIDLMLSTELPTISEVRNYYDLHFDEYGILLFHPITTDLEATQKCISEIVNALLDTNLNVVIIYPNNDEGCDIIFDEYERFKGIEQFKLYPSLRIEYFLTLLKEAKFIIGNSSAAIREAPVYGTYSINISTRQNNRYHYESIIDCPADKKAILEIINSIGDRKKVNPSFHFGDGKSAEHFINTLKMTEFWNISKQKEFVDIQH